MVKPKLTVRCETGMALCMDSHVKVTSYATLNTRINMFKKQFNSDNSNFTEKLLD